MTRLTGSCYECGNPMQIDEDGVSNHLVADVGEIDYDSDADHVAILDSPEI